MGDGRVGGRGKNGKWGVLKGCKPVEIGGRGGGYATELNLSQSTKGLKRGSQEKKGREPGMQGTGSGGFGPPCPPPFTTIVDGYISSAYSNYIPLLRESQMSLRSDERRFLQSTSQ